MAPSLHNDGLSGGPPKFFTFVETPSGNLLVGSCVRGVSRSADGGATWTPVGDLDHVSVNTLVVADDGALLAATSGGLWRSDDDATTWNRLDDSPTYAVLADGSRGPGTRTTFRLLRLRDGRTLAGTDGDGVWVDDGSTWRHLGGNHSIVYSLAETNDGTLLAGTRGDGVLRSDDGGGSWAPANDGLRDLYVHCLIGPDDGSILAGTGHGVARSTDGGRTWSPYGAEFDGHRIFALRELRDGRIAAGSYAHMWIGSDESWRPVDPGLTPDETWSVLFDDDGVLYAGAKTGLLRSGDGGASWQNLLPGSVVLGLAHTGSGQVVTVGDGGVRIGPDWQPLGELGPRAMTLLEVAAGTVLAGTLSDGMYRYREGEWSALPGGPPHWQVYAIMRSHSGRLLAGTGAIIDGMKVGGVFTCDDGGETWEETLSGRSYYSLGQSSDGTIYAGGRRCYIARSGDDGDTWHELPLPLGQEAKMYSLFVDSADRIFIGAGGQLLRSDDGAQSWTVLDDGIDGVSVYDVREHDGMLAAATTAGVFLSRDRGATWQPGGPIT